MPSSRLAAGIAGALAVVVLTAVPAAAHVTVWSPDATPGGFGKLVLRVPTESDTAATTRLQVLLPADTPFAFVSTKPLPGWTVATTERKLAKPITAEGFTLTKAVATVTWTASDTSAGIGPGQFEEFELSLGPFPTDVDTLSFPTTQTYSDGTVVTWDQPSAEGQDEPENPVPTLELAAATQVAGATEPTAPTSDSTARWLAGAALVVAAIALALAALAALGVVGRRRPAA